MIKKFMRFNLAVSLLLSILFIAQNNVYALEPTKIIHLTNEAKIYINRNGGISHNTFVIELDGSKKFFKECKEKLSMFNTAKRAITEYLNNEYEEEQESMLKSLSNEENLKKFIYMKTYGDGQAAMWLNSDRSDTSVLGFTESLPNEFKTKILPDLLHYAFAEFVQYRSNKQREIGELQLNQLLGALATMRIAELLRLSDLVVKTEYVKITIPDKPGKLGIIMDCAEGVPFRQFRSLEKKSVDPLFQLSASSLMVLDAICAQRDRGVGNYFTVLSEEGNTAVNINAFDNDLAFDKFINLKEKHYVLPPIILSDGTIALPHMDKTLANKILSLNDKDVYMCLKDLLPDISIDATINRLHQIQGAIKKAIKGNKNFLLEPTQWNEKTMEEELSRDNETYFKNFMRKLK